MLGDWIDGRNSFRLCSAYVVLANQLADVAVDLAAVVAGGCWKCSDGAPGGLQRGGLS
jgi:hypothetical protein